MLLFDEQRIDDELEYLESFLVQAKDVLPACLGEVVPKWIRGIRDSNTNLRILGRSLVRSYEKSLILGRISSPSFVTFASVFLTSTYLLSAFKLARCDVRARIYGQLLDSSIESVMLSVSVILLSSQLSDLSEACELNGECKLALRLLKKAQRMCFMKNGQHITPTFTGEECKGRITILKRSIKRMRCAHCGTSKGTKLRPCTGCMRAMYCNRECQKKH